MTPMWKAFLSRLRKKATRTSRPTPSRALACERLEDRTVPAFLIRASVDGGSTFVTAQDNVASSGPTTVSDLNPSTGSLVASFAFPGVSFLISAANSKPVFGNTPTFAVMDLNIAGTFGTGGTLIIDVTDTDFDAPTNPTGPGTLRASLNNNSGPGVTGISYAAYANGGSPGGNSPFGGIDAASGVVYTTGAATLANPTPTVNVSNLIGPYALSGRTAFTGAANQGISILGQVSFTPSPVQPEARVTLTPDATNAVGQPHTFTATVEQDDGLPAGFPGGDAVTGFGPAPDGTPVTFSLTNSNGATAAFVGGNTAVVSGGTASVTINSPTAGQVAVNASSSVVVGGLTLVRDTDPATANIGAGPGGSGPATKTYVDARVLITPDAVNEVGRPHTFTVTVLEDAGNGAGFVPAAGESVTVNLTNSNGATAPTTTFTGTTDASGQFQVTFASPTAGLVVGNATATIAVGGLTLVRDTDPATAGIGAGPGGSGPATKRFVDARIAITPDAVNAVGDPHTFTVAVLQDDGLTAAQGGDGVTGFAPASGKTVTVTLVNQNGATTPTTSFSGTTDAAGQFQVTFASPTAGVVVGNAGTTFAVGGETLTRDTDPATAAVSGPGGSGPATKTYVDAKIVLTPPSAVNPVNDPHVITAAVYQDDGLPAGAPGGDAATGFGPAPNGTVVSFSLVNSGGATAAFVGGSSAVVSGGTASVTINSPTAGLVTVNGATTFSVGGVALTRDTDPASVPTAGPGGGGPVTKTYVTPGIDIEKTTTGPSNSNPTAPDYDNEDAPTGPGVPVLVPGSTVTWTYKVTNTGGLPFQFNEVVVTDDNGTPAATADDLSTTGGQITFLSVQTGDADTILQPGEVWLYSASATVQTLTTATGPALTFNMGGSTGVTGPAGNLRSFTAGGVTVNATGFSRDKATGAWAPAYLGSYGGGLGVTDGAEDGSGNSHTVDNAGGRDNYVLFEFSENVVVDAAVLGYVVGDSDLRAWVGTVPGAFNTHQTLSDALLAGLGFTEVSAGAGSTRTADLNAGGLAGNVLVIAAKPGEADDLFKINQLIVQAARPGVYENRGVVAVPGATDSDLSHYRNPAGRIAITKYVKPATSTNTGGEGLTPGFWKQSQHFQFWVGYAPADGFNAVFGVSYPGAPTLLGALQAGGGGYKALGRHAVAALLNAANDRVNYAYTEAQVIALVQAAFAGGDFESAKNLLAAENEKGGVDVADLSGPLPPAPTPTAGYGLDANTAPGLVVPVGSQVTFTYVVTNPDTFALAPAVPGAFVTDDNATPGDQADDFRPTPVLAGGFNTGDDDADGLLDPGEVWLYTHTTTVTAGQHTNLGTAAGTPVDEAGTPVGGPVTAADVANWFGGTPTGTGSIAGRKVRDVTGNGKSADDPGLGGVTVYLDANNNGRLDGGETFTETAGDGTYQFLGLTPGTYYVREVVPTGWLRTGPATTDHYAVPVVAGTAVAGKDFANYEIVCGPCTIANVSYKLVHPDGTSEVVTDLRGQTMEGDVVTVTFWVDEAGSFPVTLVSYTAPDPYFDANTASQQEIYDLATGTFAQGGPYTLTVTIPNCYYQIDFVCGHAIDQLGPAGSNIFYTPQHRLVSADNGGTHDSCDEGGSVSGVKYKDLDGDGVRDAGEPGLKDWVIYVDLNNNGAKDAGEPASVTRADGSYTISNLAAGTYKVREVQQAGWVATQTPGTITLAAGEDETGVNFGNKVATAGSISGYKFNDRNADGEWDKNGLDNCWGTADDETGMSGWTIFVDYDGDGVRDANEPYDVTDSTGYYKITGVAVGTWEVAEVMQSGWIRTTEERMVGLASGEAETNVTFGNFKGSLVMNGDTATVNFWKGTNGKKLIYRLNNGGTYGTATALGNWLAANFGEMYGSGCGSNTLAGKTNAQVYSYLCSLANNSYKQLEAQVLATALAVYVTDSDWAGGTYAAAYGFTVTSTGVKNDYYNIGTSGAAFGVVDDSALTVWDILQRANARASNGTLWAGYSSSVRTMAYFVFLGINQAGGINS